MSAASNRAIAAIIFDWAGTLVDYGSCAPPGAFVAAFAEHGVTVTQDQARAPMGMAKREHIAAILNTPEVLEAWRARYGQAPDEHAIELIYQSFLPLQLHCIERYSAVIPGVVQAVQRLQCRGIKIGSSTGYTRELMQRVLPIAEREGLRIEVVLTASDIDRGRPAPWLIFENARRLGVYPMSRVVKVDDTVAGIEAGRNAGVWCVGVSRTGNLVGLDQDAFASLAPEQQTELVGSASRRLFDAGAHVVIESVADCDAAIERIEQALSAGLTPYASSDQVDLASVSVV